MKSSVAVRPSFVLRTFREQRHFLMLPLYLARIEDLGRGDLVRVDCAACHHVALLTPEFLLRLGLSPQAKVLDLKWRVRCRGCGARGRAAVSMKCAGARASESARACRLRSRTAISTSSNVGAPKIEAAVAKRTVASPISRHFPAVVKSHAMTTKDSVCLYDTNHPQIAQLCRALRTISR